MSQRSAGLLGDGTWEFLLSAAGLVLLLWLTEFSVRAAVPLVLLFGSIALHDVLNDRYGLPDGAKWIAYGTSLVAVGGYIAVRGAVGLGTAVAVVGAWFVLDGVARVRVGGEDGHHEYAAEVEDESTSEAMLRMQVLGSVHEELRERSGPRSASEVAESLGLAEERAVSALDYLETRGQVERVDGGYRATEQRWGKLQPVASFVQWLPRRVARPFGLLFG